MPSDGSERADRDLMDRALNDPRPVVDETTKLLMAAAGERRIVPLRARGLARRQLGEFAESERDLAEALELAERHASEDRWAEVGLTLAGTLIHLGRVEQAIQLLDRCIDVSHGRTTAEAVYQRATAFAQIGDLGAALAGFAQALPMIRGQGERGWEANLLGNRGTVKIYSGDYDGAVGDLTDALRLTGEATTGPSQRCLFTNNLAYALHLRGDIARSVDLYRQAEQLQQQHGLPKTMFAHRCNAYLAAGMYEETMDLAAEAFAFHRSGGAAVGAIEALLAGASAALALGDEDRSETLARRVLELDAEKAFPAWRAQAGVIGLEAALAAGRAPSDYRAQCASFRSESGDADAALTSRIHLLEANIALARDDLDVARSVLDAADEVCRESSLDLRLRHRELRADLAYRCGEHDRGLEYVRAGLGIFEGLVAATPSYDFAHKATRFASRIAELGIADLLDQHRLAEVVELLERVRSGAMGIDIDQHRSMAHPEGCSQLYWLEVSSELLCIAVQRDSIEVRSCGESHVVSQRVDSQSFARRQLSRRSRLATSSVVGLRRAVADADVALDQQLFRFPLDDRVVLNPSASLGSVVWGALPTLSERSFAVAPASALSTATPLSATGEVVVVAASELPHAVAEAHVVAEIWGTSAEIDPDPSALSRLDGAWLVHAAGHFRTDVRDPLMSELRLGPSQLRGGDLLKLARPPKVLVLSACGSGQTASIGSAQVGFATAALAAGVETVLVSQAVVEDGEALVRVVSRFHHALRNGEPPSGALRLARYNADVDEREIADLFAVYGAGWAEPAH